MGSPPRFGVVSVTILAMSTLPASGCSLFFVNGPPANHRTSSFFGCTSSNTIPGIDTAFAAGAVVEALAGGGITSADGSPSHDARVASGITYGAAAALFVASAAYGFKKTSECRDAQAELVARLPPPAPMPAPAPPVLHDPWVARPAPPPPDDAEPTVTPAAPPEPQPPAAASPWEAPSPAP